MYARSLGFTSQKQWKDWSKGGQRPANMPGCPDHFYKPQWRGYNYWLGYGPHAPGLDDAVSEDDGDTGTGTGEEVDADALTISPDAHVHAGWGADHDPVGDAVGDYLPFETALAYTRSLGLESSTEWRAWRRSTPQASNIPAAPARAYKHAGWVGWGHWLGFGMAPGSGTSDVPSHKPVPGGGSVPGSTPVPAGGGVPDSKPSTRPSSTAMGSDAPPFKVVTENEGQ